jgi:hypothetical protein
VRTACGTWTDWHRLPLLELSLVLTTSAVRAEVVSMVDGIANSFPAIAPSYGIPVVLRKLLFHPRSDLC